MAAPLSRSKPHRKPVRTCYIGRRGPYSDLSNSDGGNCDLATMLQVTIAIFKFNRDVTNNPYLIHL